MTVDDLVEISVRADYWLTAERVLLMSLILSSDIEPNYAAALVDSMLHRWRRPVPLDRNV